MKNSKERRWELQSPTKSLAFYKFVVDSVPSGVITVDRDLRITGFNPWAARLTGYSAEEAVGTFCGEILQGGMCDTQCPLRIALTKQEPMSLVESTVRTKTGESIPVRMNVSGLFDEKGDLIGGVESFQDISALKSMERERNNLISTFAHDMKSSLTIIGGFVLRLLHKSENPDGQKDQRYLEIIRDESGKLELLISDFLEFARLQTGKLKLNLSATSLDKELIGLSEAYQPKVSSAGLTLDFTSPTLKTRFLSDIALLSLYNCVMTYLPTYLYTREPLRLLALPEVCPCWPSPLRAHLSWLLLRIWHLRPRHLKC